MEYICSSQRNIHSNLVQSKSNGRVRLKYTAKFNNLYVVETEDMNELRRLDLFDEIEPSRTFSVASKKLEEVVFKPHPSRQKLRTTQSLGWRMTVGVLDSGVRAEHCSRLLEADSRDFKGYGNQIVRNHGTHVAKIINYYAPGANIISIKIAHTGDDIITGDILSALDYAVDKKVDILNLSFEAYNEHCTGNCKVCDYVNAVVEAGITVVTVSGNYGFMDGNSVGCPGRAEKAITVGAIDMESNLSESSGRGVSGFLKPNILAPGHVNILMGDKYESDSGTSFAAPIITGILTSLIPTHGKDYIISKMFDTCDDIGYEKYEQGFGLLNIDKLLEVEADEEAVLSSS